MEMEGRSAAPLSILKDRVMMKFNVTRRHLGDKLYEPGDEREATKGDVQHLIDAGILVPPENKATAPAETKTKAPK